MCKLVATYASRGFGGTGWHCWRASEMSCGLKLVPATWKATPSQCPGGVAAPGSRSSRGAIRELLARSPSAMLPGGAGRCVSTRRNAAGAAPSCSCTAQPFPQALLQTHHSTKPGWWNCKIERKWEHGNSSSGDAFVQPTAGGSVAGKCSSD